MRPVLLEMAGFGSFREPTTVDFTDVEYFALVGPTGAGKSTVLDALTFALYGSVPRWDDRRRVSMALAPTAARGTVRLVFDLAAERYVIVRELRRAASGTVTVKNVRLERLADPTATGTPEDATEPVAADSAVTGEIESLLGLTFEHFCRCVMLPQGDFAEFLHARAGDRQKLLVSLLGLDVYDRIAKAANAEAAREKQRAELLADQLTGYADATPGAEAAAVAVAADLRALEDRTTAALTVLAGLTGTVTRAADVVARLSGERDRLAAVEVPAGLTALDERLRAARAAAQEVATRVAAAETADSAARGALAAAPDRGPLERQRRDRAALDAAVAGRPALVTAAEAAAVALATADTAVATAEQDAEQARVARDDAAAASARTGELVARLAGELARLEAVRPPTGLAALDGRWQSAQQAAELAAKSAAAAEAADFATREALRTAPDRAVWTQARRDLDEFDALHAARPSLADRVAGASAAAEAAETALTGAESAADAARAARDAAGRAQTAAALRPHLVEGEPCPVCAQPVATLPPAAEQADGTDLDAAIRAADAQVKQARVALSAATAEHRDAVATLRTADQRVEQLTAALTALPGGQPSPETVDARLAERAAAEDAAEEASRGLAAARTARDTAAADLAGADRKREQAGAALRSARDDLVGLGAPALTELAAGSSDGGGLAAGWAALAGWATAAAADRGTALDQARRDAEALAHAAATAAETWTAATGRLAERRRAQNAASRADQHAGGAVSAADALIAGLEQGLAGAPDAAALDQALAELDRLERIAGEADGALRAVRAEATAAQGAVTAARTEVETLVATLHAQREPLIPLGAPAVGGDDPAGSWLRFAEWARTAAADREAQLPPARAAAAAATAEREAQEAEIRTALADLPLPADQPLTQTAGAAVARAVTRAQAAADRIAERRGESAALRERQVAADTAHLVARQLGQLLRSDGFPRWLVASALDVLVTDASATLTELSGGQFALTHDNGEFLIVDHADADSRRPVKTLSGGETFQASLALALALSSHLVSLAASGAAKLDAIFLDEGFGTLDEATLEVVAATLEELASGGDRMVGLVTHVPALAERVPVQFMVARDQRTSTVERVTQ